MNAGDFFSFFVVSDAIFCDSLSVFFVFVFFLNCKFGNTWNSRSASDNATVKRYKPSQPFSSLWRKFRFPKTRPTPRPAHSPAHPTFSVQPNRRLWLVARVWPREAMRIYPSTGRVSLCYILFPLYFVYFLSNVHHFFFNWNIYVSFCCVKTERENPKLGRLVCLLSFFFVNFLLFQIARACVQLRLACDCLPRGLPPMAWRFFPSPPTREKRKPLLLLLLHHPSPRPLFLPPTPLRDGYFDDADEDTMMMMMMSTTTTPPLSRWMNRRLPPSPSVQIFLELKQRQNQQTKKKDERFFKQHTAKQVSKKKTTTKQNTNRSPPQIYLPHPSPFQRKKKLKTKTPLSSKKKHFGFISSLPRCIPFFSSSSSCLLFHSIAGLCHKIQSDWIICFSLSLSPWFRCPV